MLTGTLDPETMALSWEASQRWTAYRVSWRLAAHPSLRWSHLTASKSGVWVRRNCPRGTRLGEPGLRTQRPDAQGGQGLTRAGRLYCLPSRKADGTGDRGHTRLLALTLEKR